MLNLVIRNELKRRLKKTNNKNGNLNYGIRFGKLSVPVKSNIAVNEMPVDFKVIVRYNMTRLGHAIANGKFQRQLVRCDN